MADDTSLSTSSGAGTASRAVTAFFDTHDAADAAYRDLLAAGVPSDDVTLAAGPGTEGEAAHPHAFWESLKHVFLPDADRHLFAEGLRRGGFAVSARASGAAYDRVVELLDRDGAVDMDERGADWSREGWIAPATAGEAEMAYAPAGSGTGGFAASRADQPLFDGPIDTAAIEPGQVVASDDSAAAAPDPGRRRVRAYGSP